MKMDDVVFRRVTDAYYKKVLQRIKVLTIKEESKMKSTDKYMQYIKFLLESNMSINLTETVHVFWIFGYSPRISEITHQNICMFPVS